MTDISLVISDVDGTLVTNDKVLTGQSRAAVSRLRAAGIGFSIVSSRPPFGIRMLIKPLDLRLPMGAYNGGTLVMPDMTIVEQQLLAPEAAREAMTVLRAHAVGATATIVLRSPIISTLPPPAPTKASQCLGWHGVSALKLPRSQRSATWRTTSPCSARAGSTLRWEMPAPK